MRGLKIAVGLLAVGTASLTDPGTARATTAPPAVTASGIDERLGTQVPLDVPFTAAGLEAGTETITLRELLDGEQPVLLVLAYARCTMLCSLVLRGVSEVARAMPLAPGRDYRLVLVGLDARETIHEAARKQAALLDDIGVGDQPDRWPYLVGDRTSIDAVADALGFRYAWDERTDQYAHPAVIFALTPDGRVARYLHGVQFDPAEVAGALVDARAGRLVSTEAADVLRCFRFDPASRRAGAKAQRLLRVGGAVVFLLLLATITTLILWERKLRRRS